MRNLLFFIIALLFTFSSCLENNTKPKKQVKGKNLFKSKPINSNSIVVLGTIQDAGSPQIGCKKDCCKNLTRKEKRIRKIVSLGLYDKDNDKTYLFEATPDISSQCKKLKELSGTKNELPNGIFLTHAHIGHYTGLMFLGKEAINANSVPVFTMPKMKSFLIENGPWSQLIRNKNILLKEINDSSEIKLAKNLSVLPIIVPHRDEFSETVGYRIKGPSKSVLFIPDIDKWEKWEKDIIKEISKVDYALIDGTFYDGNELDNRDISEIPHPFIIESIEKFKNLSTTEKNKIHFIHFNHTNPLLNPESEEAKTVIENGFNIAQINQIVGL